MSYAGKILGFCLGFMFGRVYGAILGLFVGHWFDNKYLNFTGNRQTFFLYATFAVMGHISKASGKVTTRDINLATSFMDRMYLKDQSRIDAQDAFREGKDSNFDLVKTLKKLNSVSSVSSLIQLFLEIQIQTAIVDGKIHPNKKVILAKIATTLNIDRKILDSFLNRYLKDQTNINSNQSLNSAFDILGVDEKTSNTDIKRAYKKLMAENHPDKLMSKGLPSSMIKLAQAKTQEIQVAYEKIKLNRNFK